MSLITWLRTPLKHFNVIFVRKSLLDFIRMTYGLIHKSGSI
ncbi:hypothetical protein ANCCAN_09658 [Ancylostoma caninum]|uniref:Uncharacterized protein n=1 Tax=Ancylostoma caninum TaxID=29170 RepID=A0A368GIX4_ANCCA|nr:hypothetical protein ANCCAN_09658 [Ancylostoma caninum]